MFEAVETPVAAPIFRVGILYSQTGDLARRERSVLQATLMAIDEINQAGGLLGHCIHPLVGDAASSETAFLAQARHLIDNWGISTLFGGSTTEMRQACLPLLEQHDALLWCPARCEGLESADQIFYTGLCLNQFVLPAVDWLTEHWEAPLYCVGTKEMFGQLLKPLLHRELWRGALAGEAWVAAGEEDFADCLAEITALQPVGIISALEGDSDRAFFRQYAAVRQARSAQAMRENRASPAMPIFSLGLTAADVAELGEAAVGHYGVGGYFSTLQTMASRRFVNQFRSRYGPDAVITEAEHAAYSQVYLWKQAVEAGQSFEPDAIRQAAIGQSFAAPAGTLHLMEHHYVQQRCWIAQVSLDREFRPITEASKPIEPQPWLGFEYQPHGALMAQLLAQVNLRRREQQRSAAERQEQQQLMALLKAEVLQRQQSEQEARLLLTLRQVVARSSTAQDALMAAIQCISQETGWPYGEIWLPAEQQLLYEKRSLNGQSLLNQSLLNQSLLNQSLLGQSLLGEPSLQRSSVWHWDETGLSADQIAAFRQFREDASPSFQTLRSQFLAHVWRTEKPHWTRSLWTDAAALAHPEQERSNRSAADLTPRVIGIPIFETHRTDDGEVLPDCEASSEPGTGVDPDNHASSSSQQPEATQQAMRQVLGILLFAVPQTRSQDKRLIELVAAVASQFGTCIRQKQSEEILRQKNKALAIALNQLRETQDELMYSEKMSALGHFVAGIAHEINTPLGAITASVDSIAEFIAQELEQLTHFPAALLPEQQELFHLLILRAAGENAYLSSRERRRQRRSLYVKLAAANIPQSEALAETLVDLKAHDQIDRLLPLLSDLSTQDFLQRLHRLVDLFRSTQDIATASERVSKVTFALKTYTRIDATHQHPEPTNIVADVEKVLTLYQHRFQKGIAVVRRFNANIPLLHCYADELTQVWVHLIYNAIQAMESSPILDHILRLEIECSFADLVVRVTDSGDGIPAALQEKIFEPFFTTKPAGEGSGLGLNIVRKIVEKHRGTIALESWPGETTFVVTLPLRQAESTRLADG